MGFCEILTLIFIVLKLCGVIAWSWWLVLLPEIIAVGIYVLFIFVMALYMCIFVGARADRNRRW